MGRIYSTGLIPTATTTARDIWEVLAAADIPVLIHGWHLFQTSDLGAGEEEIVRLQVRSGIGATQGSGGLGSAEFVNDVNDAAAQTTVTVYNNTLATAGGGSLNTHQHLGWNIHIPWDFFFPPELRPRVDPGEIWVLSMPASPNDSLTIGGTLWIEEL